MLSNLFSKITRGVAISLFLCGVACATPPVPQPSTPTRVILALTPTLMQPTPPSLPATTIAPDTVSPSATPIILPSPTPTSTPYSNVYSPLNVAANPTSSGVEPSNYLIGTTPDTNLAQAQARLLGEGLRFYVNVLSPESVGVEQEIYQDLRRRNLRATTGPDEGIDTSALPCAPSCEFTPYQAVNEISVESWVNVLRHEQRHMVQAVHNPNLARDFRGANGLFTTYAAFEEGCADDGIYVGESIYHTSERMPKLKLVLGDGNALTLTQACQGDKTAYENIVRAYESRAGGAGSFAELFPPYS